MPLVPVSPGSPPVQRKAPAAAVAIASGDGPVPFTAELTAAYRRPAAQWPPATIDPGVTFVELGAPPDDPAPGPRQQALAALGARLFVDPMLSVNGQLACLSCHQPAQGGSVATATGAGAHGHRGRRNPPDLRQARAHAQWGWDGRHASLQQQSLSPLTDPLEMANPALDAVLRRIGQRPDYAAAFARLNGTGQPSAEQLGEALASHVLEIGRQAPRSRFMRFVNGAADQLSAQEIHGLHLFRTRARCANCHFGPWLSDGRFHNLRLSSFGEPARDDGRHAVTGQPADIGSFRTPSLHHVSQSPPYMHNGLFRSLDGVIRLYRRGGGEVWARNASEAADPLYRHAARLSQQIRPLDLDDDEIAALVAFLKAL